MKTHCKLGHPFEGENLHVNPKGWQQCRICMLARAKRYREARPEEVKRRDKEYVKKWREDNPRESKHRAKKWREDHPEEVKRCGNEWKRTLKGRYGSMKQSAKSRGLKMTLTLENYAALVAAQLCRYCGGVLHETGSGIDREDHRLGYTPDNSVPCCKLCNFKKGHLEGAGFVFPRTVALLIELIAA